MTQKTRPGRIYALVVALAFLTAMVVAPISADASTMLQVSNPGFEQTINVGSVSNPTWVHVPLWDWHTYVDGGFSYQGTNSACFAGSYSAWLSNGQVSDPAKCAQYFQDVTVTPGTWYKLGVWVRSDVPHAVCIYQDWMDAGGNTLNLGIGARASDQGVVNNGGWYHMELVGRAPQGAASSEIVLRILGDSQSGVGNVWFDNVTLEAMTPPVAMPSIQVSPARPRVGNQVTTTFDFQNLGEITGQYTQFGLVTIDPDGVVAEQVFPTSCTLGPGAKSGQMTVHFTPTKPGAWMVFPTLYIGSEMFAVPAPEFVTVVVPGSIAGVVRDSGGTPLAGVRVDLTGGDAPVMATTKQDGSFSFTNLTPSAALPAGAKWNLRFSAGGYYSGDVQPVLVDAGKQTSIVFTMTKVKVSAALSTPSVPRGIKHTKRFVVATVLSPAHSVDQPVKLRFYRRERGKWKLRATSTAGLAAANGNGLTFRRTVKLKAGTWRVAATHPACGGCNGATSGFKRFTVK